jgi:uncharacterized DUF497 family protein
MVFDWDEEKARSNLAKHNVSFDEATSVFDDPGKAIFHTHLMGRSFSIPQLI